MVPIITGVYGAEIERIKGLGESGLAKVDGGAQIYGISA